MAAAPNSTKVRQTKVRLDWYYDPARKKWRFLPADLVHRAEYERTDGAGEPLQPARPHENKGWIPAEQAIQYDKVARGKMPKVVRERYGYLLDEQEPDGAPAEADTPKGEKVGS